ncbi:zinc finger BED domain-containing protein RICESLEEPER 2-like isoform X1 [Lolium rigidum]|uniref:zinc finger BED domain-containing protein RICESLEEPER 2-like isoform X1 n=1 Tax=Lolium rigidum TaxID=89674 RepID=UPI001F5CAEC6|nr:zinc finger BED domain-containing protein RICESLEEPER 2-like isoform X1 [Lolium rigidum]
MSTSQTAEQSQFREGADEVTQLNNRRSRKRSRVWDFFKELPDEGKAICVYCQTKLSYHQGIGVSHFKRHILSGCQEFPQDLDRNAIFPVSDPADGRGFVVDPAVTRDFMIKFWISANIAFRKIENGFFKKMMKSAHPSLNVHGRKTLKKDCIGVYDEEKKKIQNSLANSGSSVSFTTDMWTSVQELGYICLTAHYIDEDFNLHMHTISFKSVPYPHNAAAIHSTIMDCLHDWDLSNKAFAITLDNATSNTAAVNKLKAKLWMDKPFGGEDLHVRCAAHILNLVVQDGMDIIKGAIEPVRDVVKHVNSSGPRLQSFNLLPEMAGHKPKKGLHLDVPTRWNSTYTMLEEALRYKAALTSYADVQNIQGPTVEEWNLAKRVCNFLKNFADATKVFSMHKFPTSHRYLEEIWGIRGLLVDEKYTKDDFLKDLCKDMKAKFDKYWDQPNKVLLVASLLDPRYKLVLLRFCFTEAFGEEVSEERVANVRYWFAEYYEHYEHMAESSSRRTHINSSPEVGGSADMLPRLTGKRKLELGFALFKQQHRPNRRRRSEVDMYLEDALVPLREDDSFDVLKWWKRNVENYPVLARMARDFLAIPLSSVASESTFSTAGMIINKHRSSLNPETAEGLICSKDWLKEYLSEDDDDEDDGKKQKLTISAFLN